MVDSRFATSVHIMTVLAFSNCREGSLMTSEELAKSVRTNPTVVRRLVARLVEADLLKAYKGKSGGIELAKCPSEISLKDIYSAVAERTLLQKPHKSPQKTCAVSCSMGDLMGELIQGFESHSMTYLAGISLDQLSRRVPKSAH